MTGNDQKGGQQARRAAMLCQNPRFWLYLDQRWRYNNALEHREFPDGTFKAAGATRWLRKACGIQSRAELDHNDNARAMLDKVMADYSKWERQQRLNERISGGVV
ncbi:MULTISPECIES: hypothetical protein [Halomonadaceae]|uniref:Uncharacterized protein n=1 Tax=Vreelandella titanicae TaxID=664683 RepID=A0AAP9NL41_9GAMM|nr:MULTISPECIES: hypothetical protein [Halomonas]QKS24208.1 hypothetical protein FX987_01982 [Halomonas titanicae]SDI30776.1 hypothetical protein SAMN04487867_104202 [Halomonas titanicae]